MSKKHQKHDGVNDALEQDVHGAMKSLHWAVPECEADVRLAEVELSASAISLPEALSDAPAVLDGKAAPQGTPPRGACGVANVKSFAFFSDPTSEENLARAAREGGKIPPEIEERMRRDRQSAEEQAREERATENDS